MRFQVSLIVHLLSIIAFYEKWLRYFYINIFLFVFEEWIFEIWTYFFCVEEISYEIQWLLLGTISLYLQRNPRKIPNISKSFIRTN